MTSTTIFEALRQSHDKQRILSQQLIQTSGDSEERHELFYALKNELFAHAVAEDLPATSFYTNFTDTHFVNTSGKAFKPSELIGKVALFNFVYTKCSNVCPTSVLAARTAIALTERPSSPAAITRT